MSPAIFRAVALAFCSGVFLALAAWKFTDGNAPIGVGDLGVSVAAAFACWGASRRLPR